MERVSITCGDLATGPGEKRIKGHLNGYINGATPSLQAFDFLSSKDFVKLSMARNLNF